jgi:hypothetical protein
VILERGSTRYAIGKKVAEAELYRVFVCEDVATGQRLLLQIAKLKEYNGGLERAAYILRELKQTAELFEAENAKRGNGTVLNYERLFPVVFDSFVWDSQGKCRANILAFNDVNDIISMVPLSNVIRRDAVRIDVRTSAWVMGRLLKLLTFVHGERITIRNLSTRNILIVPDQHFVVVFDWSSARTYQNDIPVEDCADDIANAAKAVFAAIGGDPATGDYPYQYESDEDRRLVEHLRGLTQVRAGNAGDVYTQYYTLVDELYERVFYPFTALPLSAV